MSKHKFILFLLLVFVIFLGVYGIEKKGFINKYKGYVSKELVSSKVNYLMKHTPITRGGRLDPSVKIDLNNGYYFYYFVDDELDKGYLSEIIYGEFVTFNAEIPIVLSVKKFFYTDNYIFVVAEGSNVSDEVYHIIDSKNKNRVMRTIVEYDFLSKISEIYGDAYDWILKDGTFETKKTKARQGDGSVVLGER